MAAKPTIAIIGLGALGSGMALALDTAGYRVREVIQRRPDAFGRSLARRLDAKVRSLAETELDARVVWLAVSDDAIAPLARQLARRKEIDWRGRVVLHSSGAQSSRLLEPLRRCGAAVASLHPMMSFLRKPSSAPDLRGIAFGIEGDSIGVRAARAITRALGGEAFYVTSEHKALYHAVGSFSSPMIVAVLALAESIAKHAGIAERDRARLIVPILHRTVEHYSKFGAKRAFGGPLKRGDLSTIRAHARQLRRVPGALPAYRALVEAAGTRLPLGNKVQIRQILGLKK